MNKQNIKANIYKKIKAERRKGDNILVARKLGVASAYVSCVCSPNRDEWNDDIIAAMLDLLNSRDEKFTSRFTKKLKAA